MTPDELKRCGQALFPGRNWKSSLAKALDIDRMTVYRWYKGKYPMPDVWHYKLFHLVEAKHNETREILLKLKGYRSE